jgi:chemotaxis protein CheZ
MPVQRKIFRIEDMSRGPARPGVCAPETEPALRHAEIMAELASLRAMLAAGASPGVAADAQSPQAREARKLKIELDVIGEAIRQTRDEIAVLQDYGFDNARIARATHELDAVMQGAEQATQRILNAAEELEQTAGMLSAAAKNEHQQGLAQDVADQVTAIFEACNFHDLTGQRIAKVIATMKFVEEHIARMMEIWSAIAQFKADEVRAGVRTDHLINGPKIDGDMGHSSQAEIDALFR